MDEETQGRIFEPFHATKEESRGTGLGLATVYGILRQHKGLIQVRSELGQGTTFRIYLPLADACLRAVGHEVTPSPPPGGAEVVLLAEDDASVRVLATQFLQTEGYTVLPACDGHEAIRLFDARAQDIALALLDVVMPGCGGRAILEHIREAGSGVPVLLASGYSADRLGNIFMPEEGIELIARPYEHGEFLRKVREMLDARLA